MKTLIQIAIGVILGGFVLLFCMANDEWVVVHLPRLPWDSEPSVPVFEARVFSLMLASVGAGIVISLFIGYFLRLRRKGRELEKDRKIKALEQELQKAGRLMAATSGKPTGDAEFGGGSK